MRATLLLVALLPLMAYTQSWCPPGATWTYGSDFLGFYGYSQYVYVSDTLVGGQLAHRIDAQGAMSIVGQTQVDEWSQPIAAITVQIGDVVSLWSHTEQAWDTLFWLGALPGDAWLRADGLTGGCDPPDSLVIVDTATVVYDGFTLRQWTVAQRADGMTMFTETYTERLGWTMNFSPYPACIIWDGPVGMRCYSDQDLSLSFTNFGCETLLDIAERGVSGSLTIFPNPGTTHFTFDLPVDLHTITVMDATGRVVLEQRTADGRPVIGTEALPAGLYRITVRDEHGAVSGATWVKER
ncbi:MAG: T9SS type A sorting domain-containing protein, partial [Flavobacteriales bacterium]|nr:T9SS type A sorting domain-containing protein [Flavobacteriales bacterium]